MRILLVEDNVRLQELVAGALHVSGYAVETVTTAAELLSSAAPIRFDLLIVDRMLPDSDGLDAVRALRAEHCTVPILIISAKGSVEDRIHGLDAGADDYLTKPFDDGELLARVRALLRRPSKLLHPVLRSGNMELDEATGLVRCSGDVVDIALSERRLLALLMRRCGCVVGKLVIEEALSELERPVSANAIEAQVSRLRKTLKDLDSGIVIETVVGLGYRLRSPG